MKCPSCNREIGYRVPDRNAEGRPVQTFERCPHTGQVFEIKAPGASA